jgi:hypothetical protein
MTSRERRWDELQTRWAKGERLSLEEEDERLAFAEHDALARSELELFKAVRARAEAPDEPVEHALIDRALEAVKSAPRLRLVTPGSGAATPAPTSQPRSRPRAARIAVPALLLAAAGVFGLLFARSLPSTPVARSAEVRAPLAPHVARAELVLAAGQVQVTGRHVNIGQRPLAEGESVTTGEGRACLTIDPGIDVCLATNTAVELESLTASGIRLRVTRGTALASLSRRAPGTSFALVMADVSATAHGTTYVARHEADESEVIVVEGVVQVARGRGNRVLVDAHSRVVVPAKAEAFVKGPVGRNEEARLLALMAPHRLWAGATLGVLDLAAAPPATLQASVDDEGPLPLPLQTFVSTGRHAVTWRDAAGAEATSWVDIPAGETRRLVPPAANSPRATASGPIEKPSATALLEQARRELAHGRARQALSLYEQLRSTYPASAEARTVLVTMGKLELDLGRPGRALDRFEGYLRGGGPLAPEALAGKSRALRALGRTREERRAIQQYLAAHPDGFETPLFTKRLGELGGP